MKHALLLTVIDDDESVREALPDLLRTVGYAVHAFDSAEAFLSSESLHQTSCLILDMAMPGMTGPELQRELTRRQESIPIIFITAHCEETLTPQMIANGAVALLCKPFSEAELLDALRVALRTE